MHQSPGRLSEEGMIAADTSFNIYSAMECLSLELLFFVVLLVSLRENADESFAWL